MVTQYTAAVLSKHVSYVLPHPPRAMQSEIPAEQQLQQALKYQ